MSLTHCAHCKKKLGGNRHNQAIYNIKVCYRYRHDPITNEVIHNQLVLCNTTCFDDFDMGMFTVREVMEEMSNRQGSTK